MDEEQLAKLLAGVKAITDAMAGDMTEKFAAMDSQYKALADSVAELKKKDSAGERDIDGATAEPTAADSRRDSVSRGEFRALQERVNDVTIKQAYRRPADRDALAELQARADVAYRCVDNTRAPEPMQGETVVDYAVRLHRPLQRHSKRFAKSELAVIARDPATFNTVLDGIRADAYEAGLNPVDLPMFQHREIKTESPGGHRITSFVGTGTFAAMMARAPKRVIGFHNEPRIGRPGVPNSSGGSIN